ncbi:F-box/LRR-repeat protein 20 [Trichinella pseudospiralis]|uniref:F-box/LRR-repeat protein 20 n=2 Tax=Trichinella pseudospiralis TaxID=6337 RepID=A0A0V1IY48_TRIPS|nr:F-box/LRR-repeat protein 20 [Trichinella pseudospiralis]KRY73003.1 F-box/LRR-repeat protein 20 [Trichinella pseudospiralis]KRY88966.1 F-box/LRR-repeat protein 20 [Trichinella pseudospiralis]KRZ27533.1 F-box/LRR-repeat protein 20 [Trichinella pseudospiralis]
MVIIDLLDDDALCYIFQRMHLEDWVIGMRVCRRWRFLFCNRMWPKVRQLRLEDRVDPRRFRCILRQVGNQVANVVGSSARQGHRAFRFIASAELTKPLLLDIAFSCLNLRCFDLRGYIFRSFSTFNGIQQLPPSLVTFRLEWCRLDHCGPSVHAVDMALLSFFESHRLLTTFSLRGSCYGCWVVTEQAFSGQLPRNLSSLDMSRNFTAKLRHLRWTTSCDRLVELHLERASVQVDDIEVLVSSCPQLNALTLAFASMVYNFKPLAKLSHLSSLCLNGNRQWLTDDALNAICHGCTELEYVSLENCNAITESGLLQLRHLTKLRELNVSSVRAFTDRCLTTIAERCLALEYLQIRYCNQLSAFALTWLAERRPWIKVIGANSQLVRQT